MKHFNYRYIGVVILVFFYLSIDAQKLGIPELEYFNRRQYHAGTQNWKISQSNSDLIYIANNDGLLEYDGVNWRLNDDMGDIIVRSVNCIDEKIYIGGYNEFGYFRYDSLHHFSYKSLSESPQLKNIGNIWTITKWGNKVVFQSELMLCIFENDELKTIITAKSRFISVFLVNGMLLVQEISQGLLEVRGESAYPLPGGHLLSGMNVSSVMAIADDKVVIGTMKDGVYLWDLQTIQPWKVEAAEQLKTANIFCGVSYDDYLIFGTIQNGVLITDNSGKLVMQVGKDKGLINNTVLSLFVDNEGSIWCGLDNGVGRINLKSGISFINGYYDLGTGYVMDFYEDNYFLGTNQGLFYITQKDFNDPLKESSDFRKVAGADGQVWTLYKDESGMLCGHNLGVLQVKSGRAETITPSSINGVWKFIRIEDRPDLMLAGTYDGFILLNRINGNWQFVCKVEGFVESSRFAEWDEEGNLWVSHGDRGIYQLTFSEDYKVVNRVKEYAFSSFPDNEVGLVSKVNGRLIFIGRDAFYRVDATGIVGRDDTFDAFFKAGHYPDKLIEDYLGNIWYFINNSTGVLRKLEDGTYKKIEYPFLPLKQKLVSAFEFIYVSNSDNVFFGIEDGFAHYYVSDNTNFRLPYKVHLRSFKGVTDSVAYVLHQANGRDVQQLVIPEYAFKKNAFDIRYAATFYQDTEVQYSTQLAGTDAQVTDWSTQSFVQYSKLKEGDYTFTVKAKNRYGVEALPLSFKFKVLPPWYRHIYAKIAYVILILLIAAFLTYIFNRRIEISRQKEKLRQRQRYQAREEQLTNEALQAEKEMIKMRNEKLRSEMLFKEKELANSTMNIIQKNEFLASIKERLQRIKSLKDTTEVSHKLEMLIKKINKDLDSESHWEVFELHLEQIHADFLKRLKEKHPNLSAREQKLSAYIRMGMSSKEIAVIMNISYRAVENNRYRLRQNLGIESGENLSKYINSI
jgi:DNA-binding CsgD family transcriptional regulator/ligand-binding sensor domain-containing protein